MARFGIDDPAVDDWFAQNAPPTDGGQPRATAENVALMYRNLLGREASADEIQSQLTGGSYDLNTIQASIAGSAEANAYRAAHPTGVQTAAPALTGDAALRAQIAKWAAMPGADPSLATDPDYWVRTITAKGGLTDANRQYWQDASVGPTAFFNNPNRESGSANSAPSALTSTDPGGLGGAPFATYASNPNAPAAPAPLAAYVAPTWQGGAPPAPVALTPFVRPTLADLEGSPGYEARRAAGQLGKERSAAANGSILNGGTQQELARYNQDYASNEYANLFGQNLATNQANNATTQTGNVNTFQDYMAKYKQFTDAASNSLAARQQNVGETQQDYTNRYSSYLNDNARSLSDYLTNVTTRRNSNNDYWSHLNDLYQTGANAANASYRPGV